jgi:hypothetical protein
MAKPLRDCSLLAEPQVTNYPAKMAGIASGEPGRTKMVSDKLSDSFFIYH